MALFSPNSLFGTTVIGIIIIIIVQFLTLKKSLQNINDKYKRLSYIIILTSFASSLILYGLGLYFFSSYLTSKASFLILSTLFLITFQMISVFITQWKIANAREQLSGGLNQALPFYKFTSILFSIVISLLFLFVGAPMFLKYMLYNTKEEEIIKILFATVPILISFSIYSAGQSFVNLKNLTNLYP